MLTSEQLAKIKNGLHAGIRSRQYRQSRPTCTACRLHPVVLDSVLCINCRNQIDAIDSYSESLGGILYDMRRTGVPLARPTFATLSGQ